MPAGWEYSRSPYPMPPRNTSANSPFLKGAIDLRWDSRKRDENNRVINEN